MKSALLAFVVCALAACSDDTGVHVTWSVASDGKTIPCPTAGKVDVGASLHPGTGVPISRIFDCTEQAGNVTGLFSGHWTIFLGLRDENGLAVFHDSKAVDVTDGNVVDVENFQIAYLGRLSMTWTLTSGGALTDCAAHDAAKVRFTTRAVTDPPSNIVTVDDFPCAAGSGTTMELSSAFVTYELDLLDANGNTIQANRKGRAVTVMADQVTDLGSFEFEL